MLVEKLVDTLCGVEKVADGLIVVKGIDDVSNVLGKVNLLVPLALKKLGRAVNKVGGEDFIEETIFISLIHLLKAVAEETEGGEYKDAVSTSLLKLLCNVDNGTTGGDHIVNYDNVLSGKIATEELVRLDGVHTVNNYGIVTALIEGSEVETKGGGIIHTTAHSALIRRNDHKIVTVNLDIRNSLDKSLDHLICRTNVIKAAERNSILNSGVVSIKSNNVGNTHFDELLERGSTVERLSGGSVMLTSAVKHRHNYRNSARLTTDSADNSLKITEMIIGAHGYSLAVHLVGNAVVEAVNDDIYVVAAHRLTNKALTLTGTETRAISLNNKAFVLYVPTPLLKVIIYLCGKLLSSLHGDNTKLTKQIIVHTSSEKLYNVKLIQESNKPVE